MAKLEDLKDLVARARATTPSLPAPPAPPGTPPPGTAAHPAAPSGGAAGTASRSTTAAAVRRVVAASKHGSGDVDLAQAFADVHPLPPTNHAHIARERPPPVPKHTLADERDVLMASKFGDDPAPQAWDTGQEFEHEQTFLRKGLATDVARKLRRNHWVVQAELDLHGMVVDEAHDALSDFIVAARNRRFRCVRVIHGKGLTSRHKEPVLKGKVRRWLAHWDEVLAYTEAPPHAGGGGALLVLLKGG